MKKTLLAMSVMFTTMYSTEIKVTTGEESGNYHEMGKRLAKLIKTKKVLPSKGSIMNFDRLLKGEADIAIAQKDVFGYYLSNHKGIKNKIEIVGDLEKECVYIVARKDGKVGSDSDLQKKGVKIATGREGSGSGITYKYMSHLEDGFAKATTIKEGGMKAISKVLSGEIDASMYLLTPSTENKIIKTVMNNDKLKFISVKDWDLNDKLNGKAIYTFEKMVTKKGFFNDKVKTICTTATVFARASLDDKIMDRVIDATINHQKEIVGHQ
jgi:TRAP-type uncharacterized transport system substrate-binding protein